jgi:predicted acyltransferase
MPVSAAEVAAPLSVFIGEPRLSRRLLSVDVLRGLCVAGMVLVNFPADWVLRYRQLGHAEWDGATATDMIFPMFLFLAGFSVATSFVSRSGRGESRWTLARHVGMRSLVLVGLGLLLNAFPLFDWHYLHIPGVLQRIALCYLVGGLFTLLTRHRLESGGNQSSGFSVNSWAVAWFMIAVLLGVWALVRFVPVAGYGAWRFDHNGNLGAVFDRGIFGNQHLSNWGGPERMWDADGLLGCVTSIPNLLLGVLIAGWLRRGQAAGGSKGRTLLWMALLAAVLIAMALLLNPYLVINRKIWTDSFTLLSSGISLGLFVAAYWLLDVNRVGRWRWVLTPALVYGSNAILGFVIFTVLGGLQGIWRIPGSHGPANWMPGWMYARMSDVIDPYNASLVYAVAFVLLILAILWPIYRRGIFVRL